MRKMKVEQKLIDYLYNVLKDESLFEWGNKSYCQYHFVDRENNLEVILTDYSYFYDGNWQFPESLHLVVKKIESYYGDGNFWGKDLIDSKKWKIPLRMVWKAYRVLNTKKWDDSKSYRARVAKENAKKDSMAKEFIKTLPDSPKPEKKWWEKLLRKDGYKTY